MLSFRSVMLLLGVIGQHGVTTFLTMCYVCCGSVKVMSGPSTGDNSRKSALLPTNRRGNI